jgi:hypothetical protein
VHITVLPNKPTDKGICLKTLCDARTRLMLAVEFMDSAAQQATKRFAGEGRSAAVCSRLTAHWHNLRPQQVIAHAWFGGMPTAISLLKRGFFSTTNVSSRPRLSARVSCGLTPTASHGHEIRELTGRQPYTSEARRLHSLEPSTWIKSP